MAAMATPVLDLTNLLKDVPRGAWVALSEDGKRVVSFGSDMRAVLAEAVNKGELHPTIFRVPEASTALML
jgi:Family of unknown function (DUF5678)